MSAKVTFVGEAGGEMPVSALPGKTLLEVALEAGVPLFHDCGGLARCTTCRVRVVEGALPVRTVDEAEIARMHNWPDEIRLACQLQSANDLRVERIMRQDVQRDKTADPVAAERSEELPLAVLFCDVNGFTEFAAERMPYDVVHVVNRLFLRIGEAVLGNSGYIDKYLGDGLLALWGIDGGTPPELILNAVRAALLMQHTVRELSDHLSPHFGAALSIRVGIHFGPAIIGRIGHPARQQLTAIGDTVNVASRVESQNKELRTSLLITEECYAHVRDLVVVGDDFKTVLRGQSKPQRLYEITGLVHPDPVFLVQRQIHRVLLDGQNFVDRFYRHLFALSPEMRQLFAATAMPRQHEMFLNQLVWTVRELRNLPALFENLAQLGKRHDLYGVRPEHFPIAGAALLGALADTLGPEFDADARTAWTQAFDSLVAAMQRK
ncbi:MAG: adenylate/guanylate cyclase domain-containing protein [Chthoniobacter sp.]|uniref:adenylate/guanylate cyclase domain-containing protein n=1 Tax=Chthoniobacter sp. TaxID=2510640 RepID=UPI0032A69BF4